MKELIKKSLENVGAKSLIECADGLMDNLDETEFKSWKLFNTENYDYYLVMGWNELDEPMYDDEYDDMEYKFDDYCICFKIGRIKLDEVADSYDSFDIPIDNLYENPYEYKAWCELEIEDSFNLLINNTLDYLADNIK